MSNESNNSSNIPGADAGYIPPLSKEQQAKIQNLLQRWNNVQGRLKQVEQISQFTTVPAINELRYAGRMLVSALANATPKEDHGIPSVDDAIIIAGQYITNADHDITDALILFFQKKSDDISFRFGRDTIIKEFPNYKSFIQDLREARKLVILSRADAIKRR